jgi:regulator of nucleoside diphosphate kinase
MQMQGPDTKPIISREDFRLLNLLEGYPDLQGELRRATVVAQSEVPRDVVTMNSRVEYADITARVRDTVRLVYPQAATGSGNLPVTTPLGMALLGLREGQEIEWNFPVGGRRRLRVEAVLSQPRRLERASPASDAFVVPWEPRALDFDRKDC